jgi:hypothetical protein
MYIHMYMYMYMYMHMCIYMYVCIYIYIYTYIHTYIHTYTYTYICICIYICHSSVSTTMYLFVTHEKKPIGALESHGGQIHIYLYLYLYIYGAGGGSLEGAKKKCSKKKTCRCSSMAWCTCALPKKSGHMNTCSTQFFKRHFIFIFV